MCRISSSLAALSLTTLSLVTLATACDGSDPPEGSPLGGACAEEPCAQGLACVRDERFVGGYCTVVCEPGACPEGSSCDGSTDPPLCLAGCTSSAGCRDGYQCWRGSCRPACRTDADCDGEPCSAEGRCVASADAGAGAMPFGSACAADRECDSGMCLPADAGGFCTTACASADDCFGLPVEAACGAVAHDEDGDGAPDGVDALCVPLPEGAGTLGEACASAAQCEARTCVAGQCTEICDDDADCLRGQVCATLEHPQVPGATFSACGYPPAAGAIEPTDLGEIELTAGFAQTIEIAVPSDTVSLTLQARRVGGDPLALSFAKVSDPAQVVLFDLNEILALRDTPIRWLPVDTGETVSMLVPNTTPDRVQVRGGLHRWSVTPLPRAEGDTGRARIRLGALVQRGTAGEPPTGRLDLNVFLVGLGVSASEAPSDERIAGALSRFDALLGPTGVSLGEVAYFDVTGADETRYQVIESTEGEDSELAGLFRLGAGRAGASLDVFLVRSISTGSEGFAALGIAGGIPGPVDLHGTQHSGVVCAADPAVIGSGAQGAAVLGHVLAHEVGHYLGLFHSTEQARPCGPGETAEDGCAPFGGGDPLTDTRRGDDTNVMYWRIVGAGSNDRWSAGQGFVLRASALVVP